MKRIRIGNDFAFAWSIEHGGAGEKLQEATGIKLLLRSVGGSRELTEYIIVGNVLSVEFTPELLPRTGVYQLQLSYEVADAGFEDGKRKNALDIDAFEIVARSAAADESFDIAVTSDVAMGFRGDAFKYSDFTPEQLEALKVKGDKGNGIQSITLFSTVGKVKTYQIRYTDQTTTTFEVEDGADGHTPVITFVGTTIYIDGVAGADLKGDKGDSFLYSDFLPEQLEALKVKGDPFLYSDFTPEQIAELQRPATDAVIAVNEAEALRVTAEVTRVGNEQGRVTAEGTRQSNEIARKNSEDDRDEAEALRLSAEITRGQSEQSRVNAEGLRVTAEQTRQTNTGTAITNANNAATNANTKAGLADTAATNANTKAGLADTAAINANTKATLANDAAILANEKAGLANTAATNADNARLAIAGELNNSMKTLRIGAVSGMVTISPTSSYGSYYIEVSANSTIMIDLNRIINQLGACNVSLIINMPVVRTITWLKPVVWNNNTAETFATAGQYVLKIRDIDGSNTPLVTLESKTLKAVATGVVLYVDGSTADYTTAQINGETATRTSNSWATPFRYLQNAINAATAGDVIFVKQGTYYPTHKRNTANNGVDAYVEGDHNNKLANFVMKNSVDVYGGFKGTETAMWQREVDAKGFMKKETILSADKEGNGSNRRYHVVFGYHLSALTYANGLKAIGADTTGDPGYLIGGGFLSSAGNHLVNINCTASGNTANTNGGGFYGGTNINCTASGNTANNGGGLFSGTNNNCVASGNTANTNGGGFYSGTNNNCIFVANTGGGSSFSQIFNCTAINNKGIYAVLMFAGSAQNTTNINNVLIGNKNNSGVTVGFNLGGNTSLICTFKNNAYDNDLSSFTITNPHPENDIDFNSCVKNLTLEQAKITLPSFVGAPTTPEQKAELDEYLKNIHIHLKPLQGSILRGKGIKTSQTPAMDYSRNIRSLTTPTIGAFE